MFREMRRKRQQLSREECESILRQGTSGVLALSGDDGYPYAVPLSYVYDGERLLFHCARAGHKLDAIARCEKASFCVIHQDQVIPEEYTTYFQSVIAFGRIRVLEGEEEKRKAITCLALRYHPRDTSEHRQAAIDREYGILCMLEMTVEHLSGKQAIELFQAKQQARKETT